MVKGSYGQLVSAKTVSSQLFLELHRVPSVSELGWLFHDENGLIFLVKCDTSFLRLFFIRR